MIVAGSTRAPTIPARGEGGEWIVKLASANFPGARESGFATVHLASLIGIDVPEIDLVRLAGGKGLPEGMDLPGNTAFAIRRFDRSPERRADNEDFAQILRVSGRKYDGARYRNVLTSKRPASLQN
jgi:serine/threonine-protein kinase HipA